MTMRIKLFIIVAFIFSSFESQSEVPKFIAQDIFKYDNIIVIPFNGCLGCGIEAIELMENHLLYSKRIGFFNTQ